MAKKKAIKLAAASAVAASAFVAAAPAQTDAASNVAVEVSKAVTQMKKAYHTYSDVTANGEFAPIADVYKEYNAAKKAYANAKALVNKAGGADKDKHLAALEDTYADFIAKRVITYIDAYNYATTLQDKQFALEDALKDKDWDAAEEQYHAISYELKTRTVILDRVYGKTTRELLRGSFKADAQAARDSIQNEVTVKIYFDKAEGLLAEGKLEEAKAAMDHVADYVAKLDKDTDFGAALLKKVEAAKEKYEELSVPAVKSVSAINAKQIVVKFNKAIDASTVVNADTDALKNITVTKVGSAASTGLTAELSDDKKSVTITAGSGEVFNGSYVVNVATDVKTTAGDKVEAYSQILKVDDKVAPSFLSAAAVAKTTTKEVTVKFDEPVKADGVIAYVNGTAATVKAGTKANELVVVSSLDLAAGSAVSIKLTNVQDYNNNYTTPNPLEFNTSVVADVVAPSVVSADVSGENKVVVTFDKDLDTNQAAALASKARLTALNGASSIAPTVTIDGKKATFTFSPSYDATTGLASGIFYLDAGVKDKLGNESTTAFNKQVTFSKDVVKPTVASVQYKDNAIVATFSEKVTIANGSTLVAINKATGKSSTITVDTTAGATTGKTTLSTDGKTVTVSNHGLADGTYELRLPAGLVSDEAGVPNASAYYTTVLEVKTTAVTPGADTTKPAVTFNVDGAGAINVDESDAKEYKFSYTLTDNVAIDFGSVLNISNYTYDGKALPTGSYVTTDATDVNDASVVVTIHVPKTSVATTVTNGTFSVVGVKDAAGNSLDGVKSTKLTLVDGVAPVLNSAKLVSNSLVVGFSEVVTADASDLIVKINGKAVTTTPELSEGTGSDEGKFLIDLSGLIVSGTDAVEAVEAVEDNPDTPENEAVEAVEAADATPSFIDLDGNGEYSSTVDIKIADGAIDTSAFKFSTSTVVSSVTVSTDEVDGDLVTADEAGNKLTEGTSVKAK